MKFLSSHFLNRIYPLKSLLNAIHSSIAFSRSVVEFLYIKKLLSYLKNKNSKTKFIQHAPSHLINIPAWISSSIHILGKDMLWLGLFVQRLAWDLCTKLWCPLFCRCPCQHSTSMLIFPALELDFWSHQRERLQSKVKHRQHHQQAWNDRNMRVCSEVIHN